MYHLGPISQDFYKAFGLGNSDKTINTGDELGVALAAIQGLYDVLRVKEEEIDELKTAIVEIKSRLDNR